MIEQQGSSLLISFQTPEAARVFHLFLQSLFASASSEPLSVLPLEPLLPKTIPDSQEQKPSPVEVFRSHRVLLTPERQEELFNQRQNGQTANQRIQNAQTTLRDGVLPFSKPGEAPKPTNQSSPRMKAQQEGGFADGVALQAEAKRPSRLRPAAPKDLSPPSVSPFL